MSSPLSHHLEEVSTHWPIPLFGPKLSFSHPFPVKEPPTRVYPTITRSPPLGPSLHLDPNCPFPSQFHPPPVSSFTPPPPGDLYPLACSIFGPNRPFFPSGHLAARPPWALSSIPPSLSLASRGAHPPPRTFSHPHGGDPGVHPTSCPTRTPLRPPLPPHHHPWGHPGPSRRTSTVGFSPCFGVPP